MLTGKKEFDPRPYAMMKALVPCRPRKVKEKLHQFKRAIEAAPLHVCMLQKPLEGLQCFKCLPACTRIVVQDLPAVWTASAGSHRECMQGQVVFQCLLSGARNSEVRILPGCPCLRVGDEGCSRL